METALEGTFSFVNWFNASVQHHGNKPLEPQSPPLHMSKDRFSEIFRCKEFAGSRAEKHVVVLVPTW